VLIFLFVLLLADAGSGRVYYRLDNNMVVKWLQAKVHRMKNHLAATPDLAQSLRGGARAANYRSSAPLSDGMVPTITTTVMQCCSWLRMSLTLYRHARILGS
jgi:short subunit dehydrogenase-like uncharacterized protein